MASRRYGSPVRDEAARVTRRRVVEAALVSFLAEGYAGTTIRAIAAAAGVSEQTVYARVGNKAAVLKAVYDSTLAGDDEPIAMAERPEARRMRDAPDARNLLAAYAHAATTISSRLRPLLELVLGARAVEPDLDALARTGADERRVGTTMFATNFVDRGFARAGLSVEDVVGLVWVLNAPEVYLLQVRDHGLTDAAYERWLAVTLESCLLPR